jgi:hypothetical protein
MKFHLAVLKKRLLFSQFLVINEVQEPLHSILLDSNVINMNVKVGSKVANLMNFACNKFEVKKEKFLPIYTVGAPNLSTHRVRIAQYPNVVRCNFYLTRGL